MSDNLSVLDGSGVATAIATTESGGVHTPKHTVTASVLPTCETVGFGSVTTSATGATWVALGSKACKQVILQNDTGTKLDIRYAAATGNVFKLPDGNTKTVHVLANANEIEVRRSDTTNTQVTAYYDTIG